MNPKSTKGHATKTRILEAAIGLVYARGAAGTSVDDILKASGTGKSQFYHYFRNKDHLLAEVIGVQQKNYPGKDLTRFNFGASDGISKWLESVRADFAAGCYPHGCPIGNLANELANGTEELRELLAGILDAWQAEIARGLKTQKLRGFLKPTAEPDELAAFVVGTIQGSMLLAKVHGKISFLDAAIGQINQHIKLSSTAVGSKLHMPKQTSIGFCP
jgi:AcrR family transcriptional regulator